MSKFKTDKSDDLSDVETAEDVVNDVNQHCLHGDVRPVS